MSERSGVKLFRLAVASVERQDCVDRCVEAIVEAGELPFLQRSAREKKYPYSMPPASREYEYGEDACPQARDFVKNFIRWSTFCEKYRPEHCELAARIVRDVADKNRV